MKPTYKVARCSAGFYVRCFSCCKPDAYCLHAGYWDDEKYARLLAKRSKPKKAVNR